MIVVFYILLISIIICTNIHRFKRRKIYRRDANKNFGTINNVNANYYYQKKTLTTDKDQKRKIFLKKKNVAVINVRNQNFTKTLPRRYDNTNIDMDAEKNALLSSASSSSSLSSLSSLTSCSSSSTSDHGSDANTYDAKRNATVSDADAFMFINDTRDNNHDECIQMKCINHTI